MFPFLCMRDMSSRLQDFGTIHLSRHRLMNLCIVFSIMSGECFIISLEIQSYPSDLFVLRF